MNQFKALLVTTLLLTLTSLCYSNPSRLQCIFDFNEEYIRPNANPNQPWNDQNGENLDYHNILTDYAYYIGQLSAYKDLFSENDAAKQKCCDQSDAYLSSECRYAYICDCLVTLNAANKTCLEDYKNTQLLKPSHMLFIENEIATLHEFVSALATKGGPNAKILAQKLSQSEDEGRSSIPHPADPYACTFTIDNLQPARVIVWDHIRSRRLNGHTICFKDEQNLFLCFKDISTED